MAAGGSKSKKTATIIDVARLAGVSQQTVSRVANGSNLVREATRAKVQAAMKELGYSPQPSSARPAQRPLQDDRPGY